MIIIFRWWYFVGIAGLMLAVWGTVEARHSARSGAEPLAIELAELQSGVDLEQPFVRLGEHVALHDHIVSWGNRDGDRLDWSIYPVVGLDHPYLVAWQELEARYPDLQQVPPAEVPELADANVFVLTRRWRRDEDLPSGGELVESAEGLVFTWNELDKDEIECLRAIQPALAKEAVRVLEVGRRPKPYWLPVSLGIIGVLLIGLAIKLFRGAGKAPAEPE